MVRYGKACRGMARQARLGMAGRVAARQAEATQGSGSSEPLFRVVPHQLGTLHPTGTVVLLWASMLNRICPSCRATNKPDDLFCGSCSADLTKTSKIELVRNFVTRNKIAVGFGLLIGIYVWGSLPAPFSWHYLFKRAVYTPSFVCRDQTYSFAATGQGACSGHGGVQHRYQ